MESEGASGVTTATVVARDPRVGADVGGCRLDERIGEGGMGVVYRAEQTALHRDVAVKLIAPALGHDDGLRVRFEQEARSAASIEHPNIVPVHEAGEQDGLLYIVMRYVGGTDLRRLLTTEGPIGPARAARIVAQVGLALDAAHARGVVHRDVKPGNILLAPGDEEHAYLTDFGLGKLASSTSGLTQTGRWVGTVDYIAPEQIEDGEVDARADVYALGCVLYECLSGEPPFARSSDAARLFAHIRDDAPSLAGTLPDDQAAAFDSVIAGALEKDPADRYQSAGDLARDALAASEGRDLLGPEASAMVPIVDPVPAQVEPAAAAADAPPAAPLAAPDVTQADGAAPPLGGAPTRLEAAPPPAEPVLPAEPWRRRHRTAFRALQVGAGLALAALGAAAVLVLRPTDESQSMAQAALQSGRTAVVVTANEIGRAGRLADLRAAGTAAGRRVAVLERQIAKAEEIEDAKYRGPAVAALQAERTYLATVSGLTEMTDRGVANWPALRREIAAAQARVARTQPPVRKLAIGPPATLVAAAPVLNSATAHLDATVPVAARRLAAWERQVAKARAKFKAQRAALASYGAAMEGLIAQYDELRRDTQRWSGIVGEQSPIEADAYLQQAEAARESIRSQMSSLSGPSGTSGPQAAIVSVLGHSISAMESARAGIGEWMADFSGQYPTFRDTPGWQAFVNSSDQITQDYESAKAQWRSAFAAAQKELTAGSLPERPDV